MYPGHHRRVESASGARAVLHQSFSIDPSSEYDRESVVLLSDWVGVPHNVDIATRNSYRRPIRPQCTRPKTHSLALRSTREKQTETTKTASLSESMKAVTDLARLRRNSLREEEATFAEKVKLEEDTLKAKVESVVKEIAARQRAIIAAKAEVTTLREALEKTKQEYEKEVGTLQEELSRIVVNKDTVQNDPQAFLRKAWIKEELSELKSAFEVSSEEQNHAVHNASLQVLSLTTQLHLLRKSHSDHRRVLLDFYYKTLRQGTVCRDKGLRWIVEAIWAMNEPVPVSTFPRVLDKESVQHILDQAEREVELMGFRERYREIRESLQVREKPPSARLNNVLFPQIFSRLRTASNTEVTRIPEVCYDIGSKTQSLCFKDPPQKVQSVVPDELSSFREIMWVQENVERLERNMQEAGKREIERVKAAWEQKASRRTVKLSTLLHALEGESFSNS